MNLKLFKMYRFRDHDSEQAESLIQIHETDKEV